MSIAKKIEATLSQSSWIRKMFEAGLVLKQIHGEDQVYDFSLGNPDVPPPENFQKALFSCVEQNRPGQHCYMPNCGSKETREALAPYLAIEQKSPVTATNIVMTCGAAGALNVIFKSLLDPGDEIIVPAPYFVEYGFYADNHGGKLHPVPTYKDFTLDLSAIEKAITDKTKIILINSPNNPTGQIYSRESLEKLSDLLTQKTKEVDRTLYLVSDEPYRKIVYNGAEVSSILDIYPNSMVAGSYSKDISIPGERLGYIVVSPSATDKDLLLSALIFSNRTLGFVNAPALMQSVVSKVVGMSVDISRYQTRRDLLCEGMQKIGYEFEIPKGAFYLFPKSPISNDVEFAQALQEERILVVPGSGFGCSGYFRMAYCVPEKTITGSFEGFQKVFDKYAK